MHCPACHGDLKTHAIGGESFERCGICGAVWIGRETILALRGRAVGGHPLLAPLQEAAETERDRFDQLACPNCGAAMRVYDYRGGSVTVDQCAGCDHIFLDAGELSRILEEWENGFELSDEAKTALMVHHIERGAATDGPGWTLLVSILGGVLWGALRVLGVSHEMGIGDSIFFLVGLGIALITGILYWRRVMVQRRRDHVRHVRKATAYALDGDAPLAPEPARSPAVKERRLPPSKNGTSSPRMSSEGTKAFPKPGE